MLISDIITEVISEVGGDTSDTALAAKMLIFTKGALRRFPLFCRSRLLFNTSYATLESEQNTLSVPTYFLNEKSMYYEEDGARHFIEKITDDEFNSIINTQSSGTPKYYRIINNTIEFDKKSDQSRVIYVEHLIEVDDITAASTFFGSTDMLEVLKDGIKATYYTDYVEDDKKGSTKLALFKTGLDELETRYMVQTMGNHIGD